MKTPTPTGEQFRAYEKMFGYFNARLFKGALPPCLLNFSRKANTLGFFAPERWDNSKEHRHEISLNPVTLKGREPIEVASTLVHEMVHQWQADHGKPSRSGYHNHEWAAKMEGVGLVPSSTGEPGGAKVGQKMTHYIAKGGAFARAFAAMPKDFYFPWACAPEPIGKKGKPADRNKVKYSCEGCAANVWGKPGLAILCGDCDEPYAEVN